VPREAPTALLSPPPLRLLPGGAIQFPGGSISRCGPAPFMAQCKRLGYATIRFSAIRCCQTDIDSKSQFLMRYAVLTLAFLFGLLSCIAVAGLLWRLLGWSVAGAFQSVLYAPKRPFDPHGTRNLVSVVNRFDFLHRVVVSAISSPMAIGSKRRQRCITKRIPQKW
jgi:hypothetical protein